MSDSLPPHRPAHQAPLFIISWSLLRFMSIRLVMLSNPSYPLPPPFPFAFNLSQHQSPFWWVGPSHRGQSSEASASVLPVNIQDWFPLGLTDLISSLSKGLKSLLQHHNSKASILQHSAFFIVQLSHLYMTSGKTIALTTQIFCQQSDVSVF